MQQSLTSSVRLGASCAIICKHSGNRKQSEVHLSTDVKHSSIPLMDCGWDERDSAGNQISIFGFSMASLGVDEKEKRDGLAIFPK